MTPNIVIIRCICGRNVRVPFGGSAPCGQCGARLEAKFDGEYVQPWVHIPEDSLDERRANGKSINHSEPVVRGWRW